MIVEESELNGNLPRNKIIHGYALKVLKKLPDNSIDCIVTSPPYYGLRVYEQAETIWDEKFECKHEWIANSNFSKRCIKCDAWFGQLGLEPSLEKYIDHLFQITEELKRVLKQSGVMFWIHGDCYGGTQGKNLGYPDQKLKKNEIIPRFCKSKKYKKCLLLAPYRLALRMIDEQGWILRNIIIWHKPNHLPSPVNDRFTNAYEPIFMFVKSNKPVFYYNIKTNLIAKKKPLRNKQKEGIDYEWREINNKRVKVSFWRSMHYWFDLDTVRVPLAQSTLKRVKYNFKSLKSCYAGLTTLNQQKFAKKITNIKGKNPGDVWSIGTQPFHGEHFATFPEKLVERLIKVACSPYICKKCGLPANDLISCDCKAGFVKGIVLDPFAGSGTTGLVAKKLGRDFLLIEISRKYCELAKRRIELMN